MRAMHLYILSCCTRICICVYIHIYICIFSFKFEINFLYTSDEVLIRDMKSNLLCLSLVLSFFFPLHDYNREFNRTLVHIRRWIPEPVPVVTAGNQWVGQGSNQLF